MNQKVENLKGKLIVSCQALPDEPLHSSFIMGRMALAAKQGGASGIRANTKEDIKEIRSQVDLPVIGIVKRDYDDSDIYMIEKIGVHEISVALVIFRTESFVFIEVHACNLRKIKITFLIPFNQLFISTDR